MAQYKTSNEGEELDVTEKRHIKSIVDGTNIINFLNSILENEEEEGVISEVQDITIRFINDGKRKCTLKIKSKGLTFETTATPSRKAFNKYITRYISKTKKNVVEKVQQSEKDLKEYRETRGVNMFQESHKADGLKSVTIQPMKNDANK